MLILSISENSGAQIPKWYEGAHPYSIASNQGVENKNLEIKDDFSYRERLDMTKFVKMQEGIVTHNSMNDDSILYLPRVAILKPDSDGKIDKKAFNLQELRYKYYLENLKPVTSGTNQPPKRKPGRIIEIIPDGKVNLCSNPGMNLGPVTKIIALPTIASSITSAAVSTITTAAASPGA